MHKDTKNTLFIIDGSSFLYRAYYGLKPLHSHDGKPIQAVYGFCRMIKKLIDMFNPEQCILVWDSKGKTTRHEMYDQYKATRQAPPSDLFEQKELIIQFADMISLKQLAQSGIEADDLIYSLMHDWTKIPGNNVVVISSDKDMGQMLSDHVQMYDSFKEEMITKTSFEEKMGFPVERIPFYFALLGDTSDNIPGVKGIGKQGAIELVNQFNSLEDLYKNLDKVTSKRALTALNAHKAEAFLSEKLFLFQYHTTNLDTHDLLFNKKNWTHAQPLFQKLAFKSLLKDLGTAPEETQHVASPQEKGYQFITVTTEEQLDALCNLIQEKKLFAYDTEGDGLNPLVMQLMGISLCVQEREAFYIPVGHTSVLKSEQLEKFLVIKKLKPLFEDSSIKKIAHHAKFDQHVIAQEGIEVNGLIFDTMIAAFLVKEEWQRASLKELSAHYLQEPMLTFDQVVTQKKYKTIAQVPLQEATEYAAADAHQTFKLYPILDKLLQERSMDRIYYAIELPLIQVLYLMEKRGIHCDTEYLKELDLIVTQKLEAIKKPILDLLGSDFKEINLNSPKQVEDLLFTHLKLPLQKKNSKSGSYSTDNEVLIELAKIHPIPGYIAQYRELFKLKTTYIEALPEYVNKKTGNIHTSFSQIRTATGRLSSSEPNLQNIPVEGFGSNIRAAFKPESGHLFLSADYSQIELRVLAHLSKDTNLVNAFLAGHDIHAQSASKIFKVPLNEVTQHQRSIGKRINFSILYGLTPYGLSKDLSISLKDAKLYIDTYFEQYPKVRIWMDKVIEEAKKNGYVTTVHGRRRAVPGIYEKNKNLYELACRIAINTVAQGTAAEIMKIGMLRVETALEKSGYNAKLLLQIHDELLITVAKEQAEQVKELVKQELESVVRWNIALKVNTAFGANWQETK